MSIETASCTFCQTVLHSGLKAVRLRVPGKATAFQSKFDYLCGQCLKQKHGCYKIVKKP